MEDEIKDAVFCYDGCAWKRGYEPGGAIGVARGRGGRRRRGGGRVPPVERDPQRLVCEHLQVGGEAVGALHVRHLEE